MTDRTDGDDQSSSSDDLIRRAREDLQSNEYASPEPTVPTGGPAPEGPAEPPATPEPVTRPSDYIRAEYQDQAVPAATPVPTQPTYQAQQPSFLSRYGRLMIVGVVILGFVIFNMFDRTTSIEDLAVGDCLLMPTEETITDVESADCTGDHELEVFALVTLPAGDAAPYPGENVVAEDIFNLCLPRFEPYVGISFSESIWFVNTIYPSQESWEDVDDREGTCVLFQPGADNNPMTLTGSARNSNQ